MIAGDGGETLGNRAVDAADIAPAAVRGGVKLDEEIGKFVMRFSVFRLWRRGPGEESLEDGSRRFLDGKVVVEVVCGGAEAEGLGSERFGQGGQGIEREIVLVGKADVLNALEIRDYQIECAGDGADELIRDDAEVVLGAMARGFFNRDDVIG